MIFQNFEILKGEWMLHGKITPSDVSQGDKGYPHSDDYDKLKDFLNKTKPLRYKNSNYTGWLVVK